MTTQVGRAKWELPLLRSMWRPVEEKQAAIACYNLPVSVLPSAVVSLATRAIGTAAVEAFVGCASGTIHKFALDAGTGPVIGSDSDGNAVTAPLIWNAAASLDTEVARFHHKKAAPVVKLEVCEVGHLNTKAFFFHLGPLQSSKALGDSVLLL